MSAVITDSRFGWFTDYTVRQNPETSQISTSLREEKKTEFPSTPTVPNARRLVSLACVNLATAVVWPYLWFLTSRPSILKLNQVPTALQLQKMLNFVYELEFELCVWFPFFCMTIIRHFNQNFPTINIITVFQIL